MVISNWRDSLIGDLCREPKGIYRDTKEVYKDTLLTLLKALISRVFELYPDIALIRWQQCRYYLDNTSREEFGVSELDIGFYSDLLEGEEEPDIVVEEEDIEAIIYWPPMGINEEGLIVSDDPKYQKLYDLTSSINRAIEGQEELMYELFGNNSEVIITRSNTYLI
jgi:hypothetical protein